MDNLDDDPHDPTRWPAWAVEPVTLAASRADYPGLARTYVAELADVLLPVTLDAVEHVGSTAVAGLVAKPVVDLTARLPDPAAWCDEHGAELARRAWHLVPPQLDARERRLLVRVDPAGTHRLAHLHLLWPGSRRHGEFLAFRDALRADADLGARYADLKRAAAAAHGGDREAYTASKEAFVAEVLGRRPATG